MADQDLPTLRKPLLRDFFPESTGLKFGVAGLRV
jgi:hypothetical protein